MGSRNLIPDPGFSRQTLESLMTRLTYKVVRRPGGWAVEYDDQVLCCYRSQEQAIAEARLRGRNGWEHGGKPCRVQVHSTTGLIRTEATFGHEERIS